MGDFSARDADVLAAPTLLENASSSRRGREEKPRVEQTESSDSPLISDESFDQPGRLLRNLKGGKMTVSVQAVRMKPSV